MRVALLLPLVAGLGCLTSAPPEPDWNTNMDRAISLAKRGGKPLFVLSILGDIKKRC